MSNVSTQRKYVDNIKKNVFALSQLSRREIKRKYARSYLGILWSVLSPLLYMVVMSLIFSSIFKSSIDKFPTYFLTAYIIWNLFSTATVTSMTALVDNRELIMKTKLSYSSYIMARVLTAVINSIMSLFAYFVVLVVYKVNFSFYMLFFVFDFVGLIFFVTGISLLTSIVYVYYRDFKFIYTNFLVLLDHLIAMYYPIEILPPLMRGVVNWNPLYVYVKFARDCMLYKTVPSVNEWVKISIISFAGFLLGSIIFKKNKQNISLRL